MTSPGVPGTTNLDDVLNEYVSIPGGPSHVELVQWIKRYPQFRQELTEFTASWTLQDVLPPAKDAEDVDTETLVSRGMNVVEDLLRKPVLVGAIKTDSTHEESEEEHEESEEEREERLRPVRFWRLYKASCNGGADKVIRAANDMVGEGVKPQVVLSHMEDLLRRYTAARDEALEALNSWKGRLDREVAVDVPAAIPLLEELADQEHRSWTGWTTWMLGAIEKDWEKWGEDAVLLHGDFEELGCVQRWRRQIETPYTELSEKERKSDRKEVREKWPLYSRAVQAKSAAS